MKRRLKSGPLVKTMGGVALGLLVMTATGRAQNWHKPEKGRGFCQSVICLSISNCKTMSY